MKALDPDRTRRYETVNGLAMDIERHLANEPVIARRPSTVYRLSRLARALETRRRLFGVRSPEVGAVLTDYAKLLRATGRARPGRQTDSRRGGTGGARRRFVTRRPLSATTGLPTFSLRFGLLHTQMVT